jgi:FtsP/CotA-like multicopper oxidase with cupredoxin domain
MRRVLTTALFATGLLAAVTTAQDLRLNKAIDYNPDPKIFETLLFSHEVEVQLVDGKKTWMMAYNGSTPGPTIDANVGDTLVVHYINLLQEPSTIHWHGVEMPATMDGSHIAQLPVPRFGYFRYEFKLNNAATYWYHPHIKTNEQIEKGLYGALIVRDRKHDRAIGIPPSRERVVFLDDIQLDKDNKVAPFATNPKATFIPWQRAEALANARPGNHVLVNSQEVTDTKIPTLNVLAGAAYRLRFINVSSGEIFRMDLRDETKEWYGIGSDQGLWNTAELIKPIDKIINPLGHHNNLISNTDTRLGVTLTPSDRAEVVLKAEGAVGSEYFIDFHDFVRGLHTAFRDPQNKLIFGHDHFDGADDPIKSIRIKIVGKSNNKPWKPRKKLRWDPIKQLKPDLTKPSLPVVMGHAFPNNDGDFPFFINVANPVALFKRVRSRMMTMPPMFGPMPMMKLTAKDGYHVKVGETHYFEVINFTGGDHNFHAHGFRLQHIDTEYIDLDTPAFNRKEAPLRLAYEDTIRVPKRPGLILGRSFTIMRLAMRFDDRAKARKKLRRKSKELLAGGLTPSATSSGGWLVHCHHLTHAVKGMMSFITVTEKDRKQEKPNNNLVK